MFFRFGPIWIQFAIGAVYSLSNGSVIFVKIGSVKIKFYLRNLSNFYPYFLHLTTWVIFGMRDLKIILLNTYKECKNHRTEGRTFLTSLNEIAFTRVPFNCKILRKSRRPRAIFCVTSRSTRVEIQFFLFTSLYFNSAHVLLYLLSKFRWENCSNNYTRTDIQLQ